MYGVRHKADMARDLLSCKLWHLPGKARAFILPPAQLTLAYVGFY